MTLDLFNKINHMIATTEGWCTYQKAHTLASLVLATRPEMIVEVGVFAGRSAFAMALACQAINKGKVVAIDAWDAQVSAKNEVAEHKEWWGKCDHDLIYMNFMRDIQAMKLDACFQVHRCKSNDMKQPPYFVGIAHIDGSHTDQAIEDVERFASKVVRGGFLILDDMRWQGGGVMRAYDTAVEMGFKELYRVTGHEAESNCDNDWCVMQQTNGGYNDQI